MYVITYRRAVICRVVGPEDGKLGQVTEKIHHRPRNDVSLRIATLADFRFRIGASSIEIA